MEVEGGYGIEGIPMMIGEEGQEGKGQEGRISPR